MPRHAAFYALSRPIRYTHIRPPRRGARNGDGRIMAQSGIVKYHVRISYEIDGHVERSDVVGAIFGQTEGLLGPEMNLNELQRTSKVGRIDVQTKSTSAPSTGVAIIPMSTDIETCSLIAAGIESIDKVGPFDCRFRLESIDDVRAAKKDEIVRRAKEIQRKWSIKTMSESESMLNDIHHGSTGRMSSYGPSKLACGSGMHDSDWIILVEGRADVRNLLRAGYDNSVAIEGAKIDQSIKKLCDSKKTVVAFLDGDRTGGYILRDLKSMVKVDYELRADPSVEVEEMTPQRIDEILGPVAEEIRSSPRRPRERAPPSQPDSQGPLAEAAATIYKSLDRTLEAVAMDASRNVVFRVPISQVVSKLSTQSGIEYLFLDGIVTPRLLDAAKRAGVKTVVGQRSKKIDDVSGVTFKTFSDMGLSS